MIYHAFLIALAAVGAVLIVGAITVAFIVGGLMLFDHFLFNRDGNMDTQDAVQEQDERADERANMAGEVRSLGRLPAALAIVLSASLCTIAIKQGLLNAVTLHRLLSEHQGRNPEPTQENIQDYLNDVAAAIEAAEEPATEAQEIAQQMRTIGDMVARRGVILSEMTDSAAEVLTRAEMKGLISVAVADHLFAQVTDTSAPGFKEFQYQLADIVEGKVEPPVVEDATDGETCDCDRSDERRRNIVARLREIVVELKKLPYNDRSPEAEALVNEATDLEDEAGHVEFITEEERNALASAGEDADRASGNAAQGYYTFLEQLADKIEGGVLVSTLTEQVA